MRPFSFSPTFLLSYLFLLVVCKCEPSDPDAPNLTGGPANVIIVQRPLDPYTPHHWSILGGQQVNPLPAKYIPEWCNTNLPKILGKSFNSKCKKTGSSEYLIIAFMPFI